VLVDNIRTEFKLTEPAQNAAGRQEPSQMVLQPQRRLPERKPVAPTPKQIVETPSPYRKPAAPEQPISDSDDEPPEDPPDWENYQPGKASFVEQPLAASDQPYALSSLQADRDDQPPVDEPMFGAGHTPILNPQSTIKNQQSAIGTVPPVILSTPKLPAASRSVQLEEDHPPQMLTVILRSSGDSQRDIRRISRLHGTFISYPGRDRFAFQIFEEGRGHLIEFPNDTTHLCPEMLITIKDAVGEENLRVEAILYQ
jgi:DNA polymerase-3 subunit alpha